MNAVFSLYIPWMHVDLVIARVCIREIKDFMVDRTIYQLVYFRERIWVFWTRVVEVRVIYTHPSLVISLGDHPSGVSGLSYEFGQQKLLGLFLSYYHFLLAKLVFLLRTESLWVMISGLTPDMSNVVQAKRSTFFFNAWCIISTSVVAMVVPTQVLCSLSRRRTWRNSSLALSLGSTVRGSRSTKATVCSMRTGWVFLRGDPRSWEDLRLGDRL